MRRGRIDQHLLVGGALDELADAPERLLHVTALRPVAREFDQIETGEQRCQQRVRCGVKPRSAPDRPATNSSVVCISARRPKRQPR